VPRRRVGLLPCAAVERTEARQQDSVYRAGGPTVDDAGGEGRLVGGPFERQIIQGRP